MKPILFSLFLFSLVASPAFCQTWDELFRQQKTQQRYLQEQISALKTHNNLVRRGYEVKEEGLLRLFRLVEEDKTAHHSYFLSLRLLNPSLKAEAFLREAMQLQIGMEHQFRYLQRQDFPSFLNQYVSSVKNTVFARNARLKAEIKKVAFPGHLEMTDAERLHCLQQLLGSVRKDFGFTIRFSEEVLRLARHRSAKLKEVETLRKIRP